LGRRIIGATTSQVAACIESKFVCLYATVREENKIKCERYNVRIISLEL
jgi:hypothetical protein